MPRTCDKDGTVLVGHTRASTDGKLILTRWLCPTCLNRFQTTAPNPRFNPFAKPQKMRVQEETPE